MKEENAKFLEWYNSLERYEQVFLNNEILRACEVSRTTLYIWLKGDTKIKKHFKRIINGITGKQLFDVPNISRPNLIR